MNKELELIQKAMLTINSSEFLEKIAELEFSKMEELKSLPWSQENEKAISDTMKKIKNVLQKSQIELTNLSEIEAEVNKMIKNKKKTK